MKISGLTDSQIQEVKKLLFNHFGNARILAFGSRVQGNPKKYSDLDLAIDLGRAMTLDEKFRAEESFKSSDLPFQVDLVDLHSCSETFKAIILSQAIQVDAG